MLTWIRRTLMRISGTGCSSATTRRARWIVFARVNDEETRHAHESNDDAYGVFRKMLECGHPPDEWNQLLAEVRAEGLRLQRFGAGGAP